MDERLDHANAELREAAIEVVQANQRYHDAILARIALRELLRGEGNE
jgi:hypothetical protein